RRRSTSRARPARWETVTDGDTSSSARGLIPSKPGPPRCCATSWRSAFWAYRDLVERRRRSHAAGEALKAGIRRLSRVTAVATKSSEREGERRGVDRGVLAVFAGLMLGSLIASLNLTLVAPALPTIVAELGGLADYSWIPISAMLAS